MNEERPPTFSALDWVVAAVAAITAASAVYFAGTDFHGWGDDFALYLMQAQAIEQGSLLAEIHRGVQINQMSDVPVGPPAAPWGFPAMLWLAARFVGWEVSGLKVVGIVANGLLAASTYILARNYLAHWGSVAVALFVALQPVVVSSGDGLASDVPSLAITGVALVFAERFARPRAGGPGLRWPLIVLTAILAVVAFSVRSNGIFIIVSAFTVLGLSGLKAVPARRRAILFELGVLTLGTALLLVIYMFAVPDGSLAHAAMLTASPDVVWRRFGEVVASVAEFVPFSILRRLGLLLPTVALLASVVLTLLCAVGAWRHWSRSSGLVVLALTNLLLLLVFPANGGARYLFPILLSAAILGAAGLREIASSPRLSSEVRKLSPFLNVGKLVPTAVIGVMVISLFLVFRQTPVYVRNGPLAPAADSMFSFVRLHTEPEAVIAFFKPRALRYFTGRLGVAVTQEASLHRADYVILNRDLNGIWPPIWQLGRKTIVENSDERIFENQQFEVFILRRDLSP